MSDRPTIVVDFDGVIHRYDSGWQGADIIPDPPVEGAAKALVEYVKHFKVCIFSSRSHQEGGIEAMRTFITNMVEEAYGLDVAIWTADALVFPTEKPPAVLTIDDRAWCFDGVFPGIHTIRSFKPWNKQ